MTLIQLYEKIGGSYNDILSRFSSEILIDKFIKKFVNETSFTTLCDALKNNNLEDAFMAAHTLKGLCLNMSFTSLGEAVSKLTEELRGANHYPNPILVKEVEEKYYKVISGINEYINNL